MIDTLVISSKKINSKFFVPMCEGECKLYLYYVDIPILLASINEKILKEIIVEIKNIDILYIIVAIDGSKDEALPQVSYMNKLLGTYFKKQYFTLNQIGVDDAFLQYEVIPDENNKEKSFKVALIMLSIINEMFNAKANLGISVNKIIENFANLAEKIL